MKKVITLIVVLFILCGCTIEKKKDNKDEKYLDLIETLNDRTVFSDSSNYFSITADIAKTNDAYRYYVIIDNPKSAMYGIEAVAVEKGVNYTLNMAANIGVFEDTQYNMIPGQANVDKGYVNGLTISGVSASSNPTLYVLVQWYSQSQEIHQEFFELKTNFEEE